ncbi:MAG: endonuclease [Gammaproteobacteria bacterium]
MINYKNGFSLTFLLVLVLFQGRGVYGESSIRNYDHVVNNYFRGDLYSQGGWTLYCGYQFGRDRKTKNGKYIDVDHIYSVSWMLENVECANRLACYDGSNQGFMEMESDLHNMYPVWSELVILRNDLPFGEIEGEDWRFSDCDFEWDSRVVEPRAIARGNIARAIFYMHDTYDLPIKPGMLETLRQWNRTDPPSKQEQYRNNRIEELQGRRNRFIDTPSLAEELPRND